MAVARAVRSSQKLAALKNCDPDSNFIAAAFCQALAYDKKKVLHGFKPKPSYQAAAIYEMWRL